MEERSCSPGVLMGTGEKGPSEPTVVAPGHYLSPRHRKWHGKDQFELAVQSRPMTATRNQQTSSKCEE
jgi:hypothetical protein